MAALSTLPFQPSLFDAGEPSLDRSFARLRHIALDADSWVERADGWVWGADRLYEQVLEARA